MTHLRCLTLILVLLTPTLAWGATRLGLIVTQEELNAWRTRKTDNVGTINGFTYQTIYQTRLLAHANSFLAQSHPGGDGYWAGYTGAGCVPYGTAPLSNLPGAGGTPWGNSNGGWMARAAFVGLVDNTASLISAVKTELLALTNTSTTPGADFGNTAKWCRSVPTFSSSVYVYVTPWLFKIVLAYDFLLAHEVANSTTVFTGGEKTQINTWLFNAADWFYALLLFSKGNAFSHKEIFNTPPTYACTGSWCTEVAGAWYFGGPSTRRATAQEFFGQPAMAVSLMTLVGTQQSNATFLDIAKKYFQAYIRVGTFDNGAQADFSRWADCGSPCPGSAWGHHSGAQGHLITVADIFARNGDPSLYEYTHAAEVPGGSGGTVGLETTLDLWARMASNTTQLYTYVGGTQSLRISWNTEPSDTTNKGYYGDFASLAANLYYQNANITAAMERATQGDGTNTSQGCFNTNLAAGCFSGDYAFWPDLPFMYGNLEGTLNPYSLTGSAPPSCTVSAPTSFPIYDTATTPITTLQGTASDDVALPASSVTWANNRGGSGTATGTTAWSIPSATLQTGVNIFTVTVTDADTQAATCQLQVRYQTAADATSNLTMHLPLNEGTGTTPQDTTANNHDGVLSASTTWVTGYDGSGFAVLFNEAADTLTVTGLLGSPSTVTLEARFKLSALPTTEGEVLSLGNAVVLRVSNTSISGLFYTGTSWLFTSYGWTGDLAWHAVAYTAKAGEQILYLDGLMVAYSTHASAPIYTGGGISPNTTIGAHAGGSPTYAFKGSIDNPRVWSRSLSRVDLVAVPVAPVVTMTSPTLDDTYATSTALLTTLGGSATDADGTVSSVAVTCTPSCGSPVVTGLNPWTVAPITLPAGVTTITATATDNAAQTGEDVLTVTYTPPPIVVGVGVAFPFTGYAFE